MWKLTQPCQISATGWAKESDLTVSWHLTQVGTYCVGLPRSPIEINIIQNEKSHPLVVGFNWPLAMILNMGWIAGLSKQTTITKVLKPYVSLRSYPHFCRVSTTRDFIITQGWSIGYCLPALNWNLSYLANGRLAKAAAKPTNIGQ